MKGLELLLKRKYSLSEKSQVFSINYNILKIMDLLTLDLVLLCFNSAFLDKKIQALKYLVDLWKGVQTS